MTVLEKKIEIRKQVDAYNCRILDPVAHLHFGRDPGGRGFYFEFVNAETGEVFEFTVLTLRDAGQVVATLRALQLR